jgi:hypothetical protein
MKVLLEMKDNSLYTSSGEFVGAVTAGVNLEEYLEPVLDTTNGDAAVQLANIGYSADDIVKLKVAGVL